MERLAKQLLGWENKTKAGKDAFRQKLDEWRYPILNALSYVVCIFPIPLRYLLRATLCDKHTPGNHLYGYTYGSLFWKFKYRPIKLLEIGIGGYGKRLGGESLNAWQAYFPFAKIVACDIVPKRSLSTVRTSVYNLDQSAGRDLKTLCEREKAFHIIIDDGSHLSRHQIFTFERLFPYLRKGGLYIVEDVQTSYWSFDQWDGAAVYELAFDATCVGYFINLAKYLNHAEFVNFDKIDMKAFELAKSIKRISFEHNLIIVVKGDNTTPSNIVSRRFMTVSAKV